MSRCLRTWSILPSHLRRHAKAARLQPHDQFTVSDGNRASFDEVMVTSLGDVVMVEVETSTGDTVRCGERVEFIERGIADKVRPDDSVSRPHRFVDEDRHAWKSRRGTGSQSRTVSLTADVWQRKVDRWYAPGFFPRDRRFLAALTLHSAGVMRTVTFQ